MILALSLDEASAKARSGGPVDALEDLELGHWAGVIPLALRAQEPVDARDLKESISAPAYARRYRRD